MQVILDSSFARPGSAPIWGRKKGEFRDWTTTAEETTNQYLASSRRSVSKVQRRKQCAKKEKKRGEGKRENACGQTLQKVIPLTYRPPTETRNMSARRGFQLSTFL